MRRTLWILLLALPLIGLAWLASETIAAPDAERAERGTGRLERRALTDKLAEARPQFDRPPFRTSAQSVARADLLACRNAGATVSSPGPADATAFAQSLEGVWLNQNRRTVHGVTVETDTAFYIDMSGTTGVGVLIDRNNLGTGVLSAPFANGAFSLATPLAMKQVNCPYEFVDEYVKVTEQVPVSALAASTGIRLPAGATLLDAWNELVASGYFERLDMPTGTTGAVQTITARLGDRQRVAVLPQGTVITEQQVAEGDAPGGEYELPMLTGGLFRITVAPVAQRAGAPYGGVRMRWDAEYRGAGIDIPTGQAVYGLEEGEFFTEGNAYVAARDVTFGTTTVESSSLEAWTSSSCADKNGLEQTVAATPTEKTTATLRLATGETVTAEVTPEFVFERYVIGLPGQI